MKHSFSFLLFLIILSKALAQPTISFTFDDGITRDQPGYAFEEWNQMILDALEKDSLRTVFFVTGFNKLDKKGQFLLKSWDEADHFIANHTFSHPNFNSEKIGIDQFKQELLGTDTLISKYENYTKLFRFPYLKEGETAEEVSSIRAHLKANDYRNGYVTIDASDWYIDSRLRKRLSQSQSSDIEPFRKFYLEHLFERAMYYEKLAFELTGRHIRHTILLHHNLAAALFLGDLINHFKSQGWNVISADEAYKDEIFTKTPKHGGESLIWSLAKDSSKYEDALRYPAEDSRYEEVRMNELGL